MGGFRAWRHGVGVRRARSWRLVSRAELSESEIALVMLTSGTSYVSSSVSVSVLSSASPGSSVFASVSFSTCFFGSVRASVRDSAVDFASVQLSGFLCSVCRY